MPNGSALDEFLQLLEEHAVSCGADPEADCKTHCDFLQHWFPGEWKETIDVFDFHFSLKKRVRDAFQEQLDNPREGFTYVVMDFQELGTLPIGPNEVGDLWYANNRLGYTTFTAMVWGGGIRGEETFLHVYHTGGRAYNDVYSRSPPGFGETPRPLNDHTYRLVERRRRSLQGL